MPLPQTSRIAAPFGNGRRHARISVSSAAFAFHAMDCASAIDIVQVKSGQGLS